MGLMRPSTWQRVSDGAAALCTPRILVLTAVALALWTAGGGPLAQCAVNDGAAAAAAAANSAAVAAAAAAAAAAGGSAPTAADAPAAADAAAAATPPATQPTTTLPAPATPQPQTTATPPPGLVGAMVLDVPGAEYAAGPPYRFPRRVLQTVEDRANMPCQVREAVQTWIDLNPGYEHRLFDARDREAFVAEHYAALLPLYLALPTNVERADAWRYLALHRLGGVYADSDVRCMEPVDRWNAAHGHDAALLVGIAKRSLASGATHEFNQFVMAAVPGHPVMAAMPLVIAERTATMMLRTPLRDELLAANAAANLLGDGAVSPSRRVASRAAAAGGGGVAATAASAARRDSGVLARTGPGAFTSALRLYALRHGAPWPVNSTEADLQGGVLFGSVRALPKFVFGMGWETLERNLTCDEVKATLHPEALICHGFLGTWKAKPEVVATLTYGDCGAGRATPLRYGADGSDSAKRGLGVQ